MKKSETKRSAPDAPGAPAEPTFEERLARLQVIVTALESGETPLEASVELYKEGLGHAAACRERLAKARHDVRVFSEGVWAPFAPQGGLGEEAREDGDA